MYKTPVDIFISGFLGTTDLWSDVKTEHSVCFELPGHNTCDNYHNKIEDHDTIDLLAEKIVKKFPPYPVRVTGYSMGARVALFIAVNYSHKIKELILISVNPGIVDSEKRAERIKHERGLETFLKKNGLDNFVSMWQKLAIFDTQKKLNPDILLKQRSMRLSHDPFQLAKAIRIMGLGAMPGLWPHLKTVKCPVTFIAGEKDTAYVKTAAKAAAKTEHANCCIIKKSGHNPIIENHEQIKKILTQQHLY